ncbi:STAS domain-containing protein [Actinospica robiniae]|uniref:STAS domain-containing protein n=1 Tax=Actinospica robiniae TaxID=304901 RepID=UPI000417F8E2|nr:STAS domain-containing protein [Actinospica robiniae]
MDTSTGTEDILAIRLLSAGADCAVVALQGELDIAQCEHVIRFFETLIYGGRNSIALDLSALTFCDASGLRALCRIRLLAAENGGQLRLVMPSLKLIRLLVITRLHADFIVHATVEHTRMARRVPVTGPTKTRCRQEVDTPRTGPTVPACCRFAQVCRTVEALYGEGGGWRALAARAVTNDPGEALLASFLKQWAVITGMSDTTPHTEEICQACHSRLPGRS